MNTLPPGNWAFEASRVGPTRECELARKNCFCLQGYDIEVEFFDVFGKGGGNLRQHERKKGVSDHLGASQVRCCPLCFDH